MILCVYWGYLMVGINVYHGQYSNWPWILIAHKQRSGPDTYQQVSILYLLWNMGVETPPGCSCWSSASSGFVMSLTGPWRTVNMFNELWFLLLWTIDRIQVWHKPHEAMNPCCQQDPVQAGDGSIMSWGKFMWHGLGPNNWSMPTVTLLPNNDGLFEQDKSPFHCG